jgi:hypothetical protein
MAENPADDPLYKLGYQNGYTDGLMKLANDLESAANERLSGHRPAPLWKMEAAVDRAYVRLSAVIRGLAANPPAYPPQLEIKK